MAAKQLAFSLDHRGYFQQATDELFDAMAESIDFVTLKEAAYQLDVKGSLLSHTLAGRNSHHPRAAWLPYLVHVAPNNRIPELLAGLRGLSVTEPPRMTPEQKLAALEKSLGETLSPEMRAVIYAKAGVAR